MQDPEGRALEVPVGWCPSLGELVGSPPKQLQVTDETRGSGVDHEAQSSVKK